ncbi:trypsin-like cysteine/serine peptidase domain-containing protein [Hyaloraphidium curvatum]|nr:trypsin-like cysteine/serine peptidase domain-containing protein [Hyaloraphidium curvatum]
MAMLLYASYDGDIVMKNFFCGATLIAPRVALTAARCIAGSDYENVLVQVGRLDRNKTIEEEGGFEFSVLSYETHPEWTDWMSGADIYDAALLFLSEPIVVGTGSPSVVPINYSEAVPGSVTTVIGFGDAKSNGNGFFLEPAYGPPRVLQEANLTVISTDECNSTLMDLGYWESALHPTILCAGDKDKSPDAWDYGLDRGGPLLQYTADGSVQQIGIVSAVLWDNRTIGLYMRLSQLRPWIEQNLAFANGSLTRTTTQSQTTITRTSTASRTWATATPISTGRVRYCESVQRDLRVWNTPREFYLSVPDLGTSSVPDLVNVVDVDVELYFDSSSLSAIYMDAFVEANDVRVTSSLFASPDVNCSRPAGLPLIFDDNATLPFLDLPLEDSGLTAEEACYGTRYLPRQSLSKLHGSHGDAALWGLYVDIYGGDIYLDSVCFSFLNSTDTSRTTVTRVITQTSISSVYSYITETETFNAPPVTTTITSVSVSNAPPVTSTVTSVSVSNAPPVTLTTTTSLAAVTVFSTSTVSVPTTVVKTQTSVVTSVSVSSFQVPVTTTKVSTSTKTVGKVTLTRTATLKTTKTVKVTSFKTITVKAKRRR